ncbi:MAG: thermonuclease family protein [Nitrosomonadales bacterium]|jgi:endonuclease YncB( thermonuclease family)|nr:thermonuclease family protein [Nitrosomonadales bacterium]MBT6818670.1 thermonuclease family protein [Nitrosomonadales bacterium]MBT7120474.1 thermonuclease family protein [Nitrosomonadales bacterium]
MKNIIFFTNALVIIFALYTNPVRADFTAKVQRVVDGDTVYVVDKSGNEFKVRLAGIDAPEKNQSYGLASGHHLSKAIKNRWVFLESKPRKEKLYSVDRYNRVLAKILLDGQDINLIQISSGYAWHFKRYQKKQSQVDRESYSKAELDAKRNQLGLWKEKKPIAPWKWRKMKK